MKFLHTADIHLDSPLAGLAGYGEAPTDLLRSATREAFSGLVRFAIEEEVAFMVIAGDLYDGEWKDFNTGLYFAKEMARLAKAKIPVFLAYGNHDAESDVTPRLVLPENVHVFGKKRPETFQLPELEVALHGQSYKQAAVHENLARSYPDPVPGWLNIGVLHTALEGYAAHKSYAPCSAGELAAHGYQYWALGHVHEHGIPSTKPYIVFPGNIQGRHIRETGPRGAMLVTAEGGEITAIERIPTDVLRWHLLDVEVGTARNREEVVMLVGKRLGEAVESQSDSKPLAVRVKLVGSSAAHGELFVGSRDQLRADVSSQAAMLGSGRVWIEKVVVATSPALGSAELAARQDAVADLVRMLDQAPEDPELKRALLEDLQVLAGKVPKELLDMVPHLRSIRDGEVSGLIEAVKPGLLTRLAQEG
jgi:DNA repair protein SbcD/Mre11